MPICNHCHHKSRLVEGMNGEPGAGVLNVPLGVTCPKCHRGQTAISHSDRFAFRNARRFCPDLGCVSSDLEGTQGYLYYDSLWIEDTTTGKWKGNAGGNGRWYVIIGNCEYRSDSLADIEECLLDFAIREGYVDPLSEDEERRQRILEALSWNDHDGIYTDDDVIAEGQETLTLGQAVDCLLRQFHENYEATEDPQPKPLKDYVVNVSHSSNDTWTVRGATSPEEAKARLIDKLNGEEDDWISQRGVIFANHQIVALDEVDDRI